MYIKHVAGVEFSSTIADVLAFYGKQETAGTQHFVRLFDAFFDCLNVRSHTCTRESLTWHHIQMLPLSNLRYKLLCSLVIRNCGKQCYVV